MGCDIHLMVEAKRDGRWVRIGRKALKLSDGDQYDREYDNVYSGRNYSLFSMLADVRNGYGFAGVDTGDGYTPISPPRGVPDDASPEYKTSVEDYGADGHSHSWHTLAQLKSYDWKGQKSKRRGVVGREDFVAWKEKGHPESWCGDVSGRDVRKVTNGAMAAIIAGNVKDGLDYRTKVEWSTSYSDAAGQFLTEVMPAIEAYARLQDMSDDDIRIVFYFDS